MQLLVLDARRKLKDALQQTERCRARHLDSYIPISAKLLGVLQTEPRFYHLSMHLKNWNTLFNASDDFPETHAEMLRAVRCVFLLRQGSSNSKLLLTQEQQYLNKAMHNLNGVIQGMYDVDVDATEALLFLSNIKLLLEDITNMQAVL